MTWEDHQDTTTIIPSAQMFPRVLNGHLRGTSTILTMQQHKMPWVMIILIMMAKLSSSKSVELYATDYNGNDYSLSGCSYTLQTSCDAVYEHGLTSAYECLCDDKSIIVSSFNNSINISSQSDYGNIYNLTCGQTMIPSFIQKQLFKSAENSNCGLLVGALSIICDRLNN